MIIICIEGNIGAGKSTVLNVLKKRGYTVYEENLNSWGDILSMFYKEPSRWTFTLQIAIMTDMYERYLEMQQITKTKDDIIFVERSPDSSNIFAINSKADGNMDDVEYRIYYDLFKKLSWKPYKSFIINTPIFMCHDRIKERARPCEKHIKLEYIKRLATRFDMLELEKINGQQSPEKIADDIIAGI